MHFLLRWLMVREIVSREGNVHFRRYRLLWTPWGAVYVHHILVSDQDKHPHGHPWDFTSLILWGGYIEQLWESSVRLHQLQPVDVPVPETSEARIGTLIRRQANQFHHIQLLKPTWTLVWTGPRIHDPWGYWTERGWVSNAEYRRLKTDGVWGDVKERGSTA
jgi:hypothetical protein